MPPAVREAGKRNAEGLSAKLTEGVTMWKRGTPMNAVAAFENRKDTLREQLEGSENMAQAISAATMALEQIACDLAQDEQDDFARSRPSWRWPSVCR